MIVLPSAFPNVRDEYRVNLRVQAQVLNNDVLKSLLREPAGGSAFTTMIAPIFSLSSWLPRRRDERPPYSSPASGPLACVEFIHAGRLDRRTRRQMLQPRSSSFTADARPEASPTPQPSFSVSACIRVTSPIRSRTTPIRSACVKRSNESGGGRVIHSLNHTFQTLTPPPPEFCPGLRLHQIKHMIFNVIKSKGLGPT